MSQHEFLGRGWRWLLDLMLGLGQGRVSIKLLVRVGVRVMSRIDVWVRLGLVSDSRQRVRVKGWGSSVIRICLNYT